jgi:hypothetical protein
MYSRPRRACYPQGSLSDSLDPQQKGFQGSLSPSFESESHAFKDSVSPAFVFNPLQRISDPLKQSIGRPCFLIEGVPPQPNYPSADVPFGLETQQPKSSVSISHSCPPQWAFRRSCLRCATVTVFQRQTIVKLHGVFVSQ